MEKPEIIILAGIVVGLIWLFFCAIIDGKKRNRVFGIGIIIDILLFAICRKADLLLVGLVGGGLLGLFPNCFLPHHKYKTAVRELGGKKNVALAITIFMVMVFMTLGIAHPDVKIVLEW